ncbi:MAG: phospholipase, partial [Microbacteriaceae bacterium]|nr:phospholipase [Microbacteriaceae bacterium]
MEVTRRNFLAAVGAAASTLTAVNTAGTVHTAAGMLPSPTSSGIDHIIVVMMENRSFDHFVGWMPNADGKQSGLTYVDRYGARHSTYRLTDFQGCGHPDPDHSYEGGRIEFNNGKNDGWLRAGDNDSFAVGYYDSSDLDFWGQAGPDWTVCDRYFAATMAETYPNRLYQHAAATDRLHNSSVTSTLPTIWDRLAAAEVEGKYYFSDIPFTALWGTKYLSTLHHYSEFLADCAAG